MTDADRMYLRHLIAAAVEHLDAEWIGDIDLEERASIDRGNDPETTAGEAYFLSTKLGPFWAKLGGSDQLHLGLS